MEWISVDHKLPYDDQTVFCWHKNRNAAMPLICFYDEETKSFNPLFCQQECFAEVTHWMPLPKPPKF